MKLFLHRSTAIEPSNHVAGLGWVVSVMLCLSMFFAQVAPMSAAQNNMVWVEICGEHGAEVIQVEAGDLGPESDPISECVHCSYCLAEAPVMSGLVPVFKSEIPNLVLMESAFLSAQDGVLHVSKQYCSQCRGPPIGNTYNKMISIHYVLTTDAPMMPNTPMVAS